MEKKPTLTLKLKQKRKFAQPQTQVEIKHKIENGIVEFLRGLGYKPNKVIDESIVDRYLACWYLGAIVWDIYTGVETTDEVRQKLVEKLNLRTEMIRNIKNYWFGEVYIDDRNLNSRINVCMRGIDKERGKSV